MSIVTICNAASNAAQWEQMPWGTRALVRSELVALRIAYAQRNAPKGVQIRECPNVGMWSVTIFAADCPDNIDRS